MRYLASAILATGLVLSGSTHTSDVYTRPYGILVGTSHGAYISHCHGRAKTNNPKAFVFTGCTAPKKV